MVLARGAAVIGLLLLWVFCILDVRATDPSRVRTLPKPLWQLLVLVPVLGSVLWLVAGRPVRVARRGGPAPGRQGVPPEYDRPGRAVASNPDDDAAFLEQVRRRAEEQRRKAEEERRRHEGEDPAPG